MVRIQLRGGLPALLLLVVAILVGALALAAGIAFLLPVALLMLLAAVARTIFRGLSGARPPPGGIAPGGSRASEQVIEIEPVKPPAAELEARQDR